MKNIKKLISAIEKISITDVENGESIWVHETNGTIIVTTEWPMGDYTCIMNFPRYAEQKQKYELLTDELEDGYIDEEEYTYKSRYIHYNQYGYTDDIEIQFQQYISTSIQSINKIGENKMTQQELHALEQTWFLDMIDMEEEDISWYLDMADQYADKYQTPNQEI